MKKIINGKKYDTTTAKEIGFYDNGYASNDLRYLEETLYKKKTGEFFLYSVGGPMSRLAKPIDSNNWIGGSEVKPLTIDEAKAWAEAHLDGDEYESIFGEVEE